MNNPDHISESLVKIFWVKILKFFDADTESRIFLTRDPGSEIRNFFDPGSWIRDGKIRIRNQDKHPRSATLNC
jgi:hypothetical protein